MWDFQNSNIFSLNNIAVEWVSVWRWPAFLVFFYGLFFLFFVIFLTLYLLIQKRKELFADRLLVTSFSLSLYSLVYSVWFAAFFAILWIGGAIIRYVDSNPFRYDLGSWIILFLVLFPLLFFSFIGNTIWYRKRKRKQHSM